MKKGKKILVVALLCITVITVHFISSTYAKYISSMETTDTARVAHWNINVENEVDLFKESVINDTSTNGDNIIAPGTSGEYTFIISGTAETAYAIDIEAKLEDYTGGRILYYLDNRYLGRGEEGIQAFVFTLESFLANGKVYAPGCDLLNTEHNDGTHTIRWEWKYEEEDKEGNLYDSLDTSLGIQADTYLKANNEPETTTPSSEVPGVKLRVSITARQVTSHTGDYAAC